MQEFYIDVELSRVLTRIQVDEVPPEEWDMPYTPQFIIEFHTGKGFITLTLQLEDGQWYDRSGRIPDDGPAAVEACDPYYQSPLTSQAIQTIGEAIGRHMIVHLTAYMGLFVPVFRTPTLN